MAGPWSVGPLKLVISPDGTVTVKDGDKPPKTASLTPSDNLRDFPPTDGWYKSDDPTNPGVVDYIRLKPDGTLEIRQGCTAEQKDCKDLKELSGVRDETVDKEPTTQAPTPSAERPTTPSDKDKVPATPSEKGKSLYTSV